MDVVYLCRDGENEELRYSLRSLKNIQHDAVWIFGGKPDWVTNVRHVETRQIPGKKFWTTSLALLAACTHPDVSNDFILMNDDFFIMEPIDEIPTMNRGSVKKVILRAKWAHSDYYQMMKRTNELMIAHGFDNAISYELHVPMVVNKQKMLEALMWAGVDGAANKRTIYGNLHDIGGETVADVKVGDDSGEPEPSIFLSCNDRTFDSILEVLEATFTDRSEYEVGSGR